MIRLYNSLSRKLEDFTPIEEGKVRFYHCGPTVYWTQHIGNLRGMTMGDLVVRTLRYFNYNVKHVRNYTDVGHLTSDSDTGEDKMEKGAKREGLSPKEIADKYIAIFESDTKAINLLEPTIKPRASEYITEMIMIVQSLLDKGYAYITDLAVYYDVSKFANYTKLSGQNLSDLNTGAGKGDVTDLQKRSQHDFALWFFKTGTHAKALQVWPSPFQSKMVADGIGFPGWHLECSAMCRKLLGLTVDIHMGGIEHIPVHHTNEIAQSEAANGVKFVNYWLHNEWLVFSGEKMAKSAGTGLTIKEVEKKGFDPLALRYFYLTSHYRSRQNFTWEALADAQNALSGLRNQVIKLKTELSGRSMLTSEKLTKIDEFRDKFDEALSSDLNIPRALSIVWEVIKSNIPSADKYDLILTFDEVLGLNLRNLEVKSKDIIPEAITELIRQREKLRSEKKFGEADEVRKQIEKQNYTIEDKPEGTIVRKK